MHIERMMYVICLHMHIIFRRESLILPLACLSLNSIHQKLNPLHCVVIGLGI